MDHKLDLAYASFLDFCNRKGRTTSLHSFNKEELKINSQLVCMASSSENAFALRLQDFPKGLGKGGDSALIGAWLWEVLRDLTPEAVPATRPH